MHLIGWIKKSDQNGLAIAEPVTQEKPGEKESAWFGARMMLQTAYYGTSHTIHEELKKKKKKKKKKHLVGSNTNYAADGLAPIHPVDASGG